MVLSDAYNDDDEDVGEKLTITKHYWLCIQT